MARTKKVLLILIAGIILSLAFVSASYAFDKSKNYEPVTFSVSGSISFKAINGQPAAIKDNVFTLNYDLNGERQSEKVKGTSQSTYNFHHDFTFNEPCDPTNPYLINISVESFSDEGLIVIEGMQAYGGPCIVTVGEDGKLKIDTEVPTTGLNFECRQTNLSLGYEDASLSDGSPVNANGEITYVIKGMNYSNAVQDIDFVSNLTESLIVNESSVSVIDKTGAKVSYEVTKDAPSWGSYNFHTKIFNTQPLSEFTAKFSVKVTDNFTPNPIYRVANMVMFSFNGKSFAIGTLGNIVPKIKYDVEPDTMLQKGDKINYEIYASNMLEDTDVTFTGEQVKGLDFDLGSFELDGKKITPTITKDGFSYTALVGNYQTAKLTYSCFITEPDVSNYGIIKNLSYITMRGKTAQAAELTNSVPYCVNNKSAGGMYKPGTPIEFSIHGTNLTDKATNLSFEDTLSDGLEFENLVCTLSYKENGQEVIKVYDDLDYEANHFVLPKESCPNIDPKSTYSLLYSAKVVGKHLTFFHNPKLNDIDLGKTSYCSPLSGYDDKHKQNDKVNVGDELQYKTIAANCSGKTETITLGAKAQGGMDYIPDSIKLSVNGQEANATPKIDGESFTISENVTDGAEVILTYSAKVSENAFNSLEVTNTPNVKISNDQPTELDSLTNSVNAKPEQFSSSQTGDALMALIGLLAVAGILAFRRFKYGIKG